MSSLVVTDVASVIPVTETATTDSEAVEPSPRAPLLLLPQQTTPPSARTAQSARKPPTTETAPVRDMSGSATGVISGGFGTGTVPVTGKVVVGTGAVAVGVEEAAGTLVEGVEVVDRVEDEAEIRGAPVRPPAGPDVTAKAIPATDPSKTAIETATVRRRSDIPADRKRLLAPEHPRSSVCAVGKRITKSNEPTRDGHQADAS